GRWSTNVQRNGNSALPGRHAGRSDRRPSAADCGDAVAFHRAGRGSVAGCAAGDGAGAGALLDERPQIAFGQTSAGPVHARLSIAFTSSAVSARSWASRFSRTWVMLVVAGMGSVAGERVSSHASVTWGMVAPCRAAMGARTRWMVRGPRASVGA